MGSEIIGWEEEIKILERLLKSRQYNGKTSEQLINFTEQLNVSFPRNRLALPAATWQEGFSRLREGCFPQTGQYPKNVAAYFYYYLWAF